MVEHLLSVHEAQGFAPPPLLFFFLNYVFGYVLMRRSEVLDNGAGHVSGCELGI